MKKEYISPKVIAHEVKIQNIMAGSIIGMGGPADGSDAESKGGIFSDDEE